MRVNPSRSINRNMKKTIFINLIVIFFCLDFFLPKGNCISARITKCTASR